MPTPGQASVRCRKFKHFKALKPVKGFPGDQTFVLEWRSRVQVEEDSHVEVTWRTQTWLPEEPTGCSPRCPDGTPGDWLPAWSRWP
jgi:hypothetical protein